MQNGYNGPEHLLPTNMRIQPTEDTQLQVISVANAERIHRTQTSPADRDVTTSYRGSAITRKSSQRMLSTLSGPEHDAPTGMRRMLNALGGLEQDLPTGAQQQTTEYTYSRG